MASDELNLQEIYEYFIENSGKVKNRDAVRHFKKYLTDPAFKDENRRKFKEYINTLAHTKSEGDEKVLILKTKYLKSLDAPSSPLSTSTGSLNVTASQYDSRNAVGIPTSPMVTNVYGSNTSLSTPSRQPPPYRPPPPPPVGSPSSSFDSISLSSNSTLDERPQAPPRRRGNLEEQRSNSRGNLMDNGGNDMEIDGSTGDLDSKENIELENSGKRDDKENEEDKEILSVKERTQKFNRLASVEDELSPRGPRSAEKDRSKNWGNDEVDPSTLTPLEPKKCQEWYVTASRGDYQELLKLARNEPRLVNRKDPFSTVLHWGAKHGNAEIIKIFAGRYKVNVNSLTNGGYTPLHISAQFGHKNIFKLLIEVYKADTKIRDYSGRTADYYLLSKEKKENNAVTLRSEYSNTGSSSSKFYTHGRAVKKAKSFRNKTISLPTTVQKPSLDVINVAGPPSEIKGRKKQSDKDLSFLRIGSLNVRVKKTTEAFSNFLGVGSSGTINPSDSLSDKVHKGWGSADNVNKDSLMAPPKAYVTRKKSKRAIDSGLSSTPSTPKTPVKNYSTTSLPIAGQANDSDSDGAAGFDSNWKN